MTKKNKESAQPLKLDGHDITISELAINRMNDVKKRMNTVVKFDITGGGCSGFMYDISSILEDRIAETDIKIEVNGDVIGCIDGDSAIFFKNTTIDFVTELGKGSFEINNPNAKAKCGCGTSFSLD